MLTLHRPSVEQPLTIREMLMVFMTLAITLLFCVEILRLASVMEMSDPLARPLKIVANEDRTFRIAIGIFTVHRPDAPDYVYMETLSILDNLMLPRRYIHVDKIHVFDGTPNGSHFRYFKYSSHVQVHPIDPVAYERVREFAVHRKASLNYLRALQFLVPRYAESVDAILMLEDDVMFDPNAGEILWRVLSKVRHHELFIVDGYGKGRKPLFPPLASNTVVIPFDGEQRCCTQAFLLSPRVATESIGIIERSLNGSEEYFPLDLHLTSTWLKTPGFHFYFSAECWVQHIGYPTLGLGKSCHPHL